MSGFMSLPTWLSEHFEPTWMLVLYHDGSRTYFNGRLGGEAQLIPELEKIQNTEHAGLVLGICKDEDGEDYDSALALWAEGEWHARPAEEGRLVMGSHTIPSLNKNWVDWLDLLPSSPVQPD
jgi:hypothetical protein